MYGNIVIFDKTINKAYSVIDFMELMRKEGKLNGEVMCVSKDLQTSNHIITDTDYKSYILNYKRYKIYE